MTLMGAPQRGQRQDEASVDGVSVISETTWREKLAAQSESIGPKTIRQKSEMADAHKALGKHMQEKAAQELDRIKRHDA